MNKIVNINLGGYPFTIDEDAFQRLNSYLESIRQHFEHAEGCDEIVSDIEARLAELFEDYLENRSIVTMDEVELAIKRMGTPEEFEDDSPSSHTATQSGKSSQKGRQAKRLYRNSDDMILGGVCSGISAYFGIEDPVWVRVGVALAVFMGGLGILPYIILWAILPKAKTASDKLAMKGEPINVDSIAKTVQEEIDHIGKKFSELGEEFQAKYGSEKKKTPGSENSEEENRESESSRGSHGIASKGIDLISLFINAIRQFFASSGKTIVFIFCAMLIISLAICWIAMIIGFTFMFPYESYFVNTPITALLGLCSSLLLVGIPILFVVFLSLKLVFKARLSSSMGGALGAIWLTSLVCLAVVAANMTKEFNEETSYEEQMNLNVPPSGTLKLSLADDEYEDVLTNFGPMILTDGKILTDQIKVNISKSESDDFELKTIRYSRGRNHELADRFAHAANYKVEQKGENLVFQPHFSIDRGHKWRAQQVTVELSVPQGKSIEFDKSIYHNLNELEFSGKERPWSVKGKAFIMTNDGLSCVGCEENDMLPEEKADYPVNGISSIEVKGPTKIKIIKSDDFSLKFMGSKKYYYSERREDLLFFELDKQHHDTPVSIEITMPILKSLRLEGARSIITEGFENDKLDIVLVGKDKTTGIIAAKEVTLKVGDAVDLYLEGRTDFLDGEFSASANVQAAKFDVKKAKIKGSDSANIKIRVSDTIQSQISDHAEIKVIGDPVITEFQ